MTEPTKVCNICGGVFPLSALAVDRKCSDGTQPRCKGCATRYKRTCEQAKGDPGHPFTVNRVVDLAPDHRPAVRLRCELRRARDAGQEFLDAWPRAIEVATSRLPRDEAGSWREAFESTRFAWRSAYCSWEWFPVVPFVPEREQLVAA